MQRHSFALEHLEGRALLSAAELLDATLPGDVGEVQPVAIVATAAANPLAGAFNVAGTYTHPLGNPDTGSSYVFNGTGKTTALGNFTFKGQIHPPGFIISARASGAFTLTNSKGTMRLSVKGPQQTAGVLPPFVSFTITRGTGSYANATGKGKITIAASGSTQKFVFKFNQ
jgi:hypothetical protein